jgi:tetratricopeptide (TPR) repeat protein
MTPASSNVELAEVKFKLASLWLAKGKIEQAIAGYQEVLRLQPNHLQAAVHLDHLQQQLHQSQQHQTLGQAPVSTIFQDNPHGKINLSHQKMFAAHRCGWSFVVHDLKSLHNSQGVLFDGFLENSFIWRDSQSGQVKVPYTQSSPNSLSSHC